MKTVLIACELRAGAFSDERVFQFATTIQSVKVYSGLVPSHYCYTADKQLVDSGQPAKDHPIRGYVEAELISEKAGVAYVELPGGVAVRVNSTQVLLVEIVETRRYVPLAKA